MYAGVQRAPHVLLPGMWGGDLDPTMSSLSDAYMPDTRLLALVALESLIDGHPFGLLAGRRRREIDGRVSSGHQSCGL